MRIACDIGATNGRVGIFDDDSIEPLATETFQISEDKNFREDYKSLIETIERLESVHGRVTEIAVAVAGKLNRERTELLTAGGLSHWVGTPLKIMLEDVFPEARTVLGNDAEAAAMADAIYGLGKTDFPGRPIYGVIGGSGTGGSVVMYDKHGDPIVIPTELGHMCVDPSPDAPLCGCGERGHLEAYTGGNNMPARFGHKAEDLTGLEWVDVLKWWLIGLQNALLLHPVDAIIFSGGLACKQPWLLATLQALLNYDKYGRPVCVVSAFGEGAGLKGALALLAL